MQRWLGLALALAITACGDGDPKGHGSGGPGGGDRKATTLVWGRGSDSSFLDPARVTDGESVKVCTNLFDTLVRFEPGSLELRPGLAERWEVSEEGRTWTFHLREAKFHDGTPVDADAVVFSFLRQKDKDHPAHVGEFPYWEDNFGLVTGVRAVDPRTAVVELAEPFAPFEATMSLFSMAIQSPTAWKSEGVDPGTGKYAYPFHEKPVGSGPFRFVSWRRDEAIVLERFDGWWGGRAGVDRLMFRTITDNAQRLIGLEQGQYDIIDGVNPQDVGRVEGNPKLALLTRPALNIAYLSMNNLKPPFTDPRVRQAVAFALSKERIRTSAYDGQGDLAVVPLPVGMPGRIDIPDRVQDRAKAKALLADAGFPGGFETTLWFGDNPRPYMPRPKDVATSIAEDLKAVGIKVSTRMIQWKQYLQDCQDGNHDMCLLGWSADYGDPDNFLYVLLDRSNARKGSASNVSFYQGQEAHDLLTRARVTTDRSERMKLYADAQRILFDEAPMVPLMQMPDLRAASGRVKGYVIYPAGGEYLESVTVE